MSTETSLALQHLHHLLQQLDAAETLYAHGPRRIAAADRKIQAAETALPRSEGANPDDQKRQPIRSP